MIFDTDGTPYSVTQYGEHSSRLLDGVMSMTSAVTKLTFAIASKIRNLKRHIPNVSTLAGKLKKLVAQRAT